MPGKGMLLQFLNNDADEDEGLADAGIETFRDSPYASVARECGQNTRDARISENVVLRFDWKIIPTETIPDIGTFKSAVTACDHRAKERKDDKEIAFFGRARALLNKETIGILIISDEGTHGLTGPCVPGTVFHSLVKATGVSKKDSSVSGGSFGIGKKAAFAISELYTNFYSTVYHDAHGTAHFLAQGKCTLVSHAGPKEEKLRATGYWGKNGFLPVSSNDEVPDWLKRTVRGTSILSIGFTPKDRWSWRIAESIVRNFFSAIHDMAMVCEIDGGKIIIDRSTLPQLFGNKQVTDAAYDNDSENDLAFSQQLYVCLTSADSVKTEKTFLNIGKMRLRILVREGLPKRICIIRNGMYITDELRNFNDKLTRFKLCSDFVAILECADEESNRLFRSLENPRHDELSAERLYSDEEKMSVRLAMRELIKWIREEIRNRTASSPESAIQLQELNEFFPDTSDENRIPDPTSPESDPSRITYTMIPQKNPLRSGKGDGKSGGAGHKGGSKGNGGPGGGEKAGTGDGGEGRRGSGRVQFDGFRNLPEKTYPSRRRVLLFTPDTSGPAMLTVYGSGMNENQRLRLTGIDGKPVDGATPSVLLREGERNRISIELAEEFQGPLEISLTSNADGEY